MTTLAKTLDAQVADLNSNITKLTPSDQRFAGSLVAQFNRKKALSEKQAAWVATLLERAINPPKAKKADIGSVDALAKMFATAGSRLKWPKISIEINGLPLRFSVAGQKARFPGSINVVNTDTTDWLGRIHQDGVFEASKRLNDIADITKALKAFNKDPLGLAAQYGKKSGRCCMCNRELTDPTSVANGYGPVCASNFGLA